MTADQATPADGENVTDGGTIGEDLIEEIAAQYAAEEYDPANSDAGVETIDPGPDLDVTRVEGDVGEAERLATEEIDEQLDGLP